MFSVTQYGKELDKSKYNWDEKLKIFSTNESCLVLDFSEYSGVTFKTGSGCIFDVGEDCVFNTSFNCVFNTGPNCIFKTDFDCTFKTGSYCTFNTEIGCIFSTGKFCVFNVASGSILRDRSYDKSYIIENETIIINSENLIEAKDIIVEDIKINDLNKNEIQIIINNKFYYTENKSFLPVLEAFKNKNDTEFLMRETDSRLYRHLLKNFKMN